MTTVLDEATAIMIVIAARDLNPNLPIIARAATEEGIRYLAETGADHIVHPELEGGLEVVYHTLLSLGYPLQEVHRYAESVRHDLYDFDITADEEHQSLHDLLLACKGVEIIWVEISDNSSLVGKSLAESNIRSQTGASVVALVRDKQLIPNPKSMFVFEAGDRVGVIGDNEQLKTVQSLMKFNEDG